MEGRTPKSFARGVGRAIRGHALPLLVASLALVALSTSIATAKEDEPVCSTAVVVVKIHADWCSTCKALDSVWTQLVDTKGDDVTTVELDVSDRVAFNASKAVAQKLGIARFFDEYRSRTGTVAVLPCNSSEPVAVLNGERDLRVYREAIAKASRSS